MGLCLRHIFAFRDEKKRQRKISILRQKNNPLVCVICGPLFNSKHLSSLSNRMKKLCKKKQTHKYCVEKIPRCISKDLTCFETFGNMSSKLCRIKIGIFRSSQLTARCCKKGEKFGTLERRRVEIS